MTLGFHGAVGTVTGSKYLIEVGRQRVLVDCGLFQGFKQLRLRNRAPLPFAPAKVDAVILTHAHIDHSGYLPAFVRDGFRGAVHATDATCDLAAILLPDSGFLQEKDAEFANRHGFSRHKPAKPLYTRRDAEVALERLLPVPFDHWRRISRRIRFRLRPAGHILGAAIVELEVDGRTIVFSGDLGRRADPIMVPPTTIRAADYLVVESTYGDRRHLDGDPQETLREIIVRVASRGGTVLIPSFAVGRAQSLLYHLERLKARGAIPDIPVFLDSPMSIDASELFRHHSAEHRLSAAEARAVCAVARYVRTAEESIALNGNRMPKIIISASGMATGGRVLHHLKHLAGDERNALVFAGFQAGGTRGAAIVAGAESVKIHGGYVPIRAEVHNLEMLSSHADSDGLMAWLGGFETAPAMTFVTHGEPAAADALRHRIKEELGWNAVVPEYRDSVRLD
ncbi:MBL fold metallo-hydrolase RNA specificity domain-containing protein [Oceanibacterium hippocampi]|uniref:MBL fold metallo-hydrolase RNA specificity domain-containing protein n=1 Tax=Oceanibacterium hippocampi TaxID=745714 RepID=UPI000A271403